jgi:glutamine amidotransferase
MKISIVDYGLGNLFSLSNAFEYLDKKVLITSDLSQLSESDVLVLPGVGAFGDGMKRLQSTGIDQILVDHALKNKPILGICLGMQLLLESSEEFGYHLGLGIIKGTVQHFQRISGFNKISKVPHVGWTKIDMSPHSYFSEDLECGEMYFSHSLCVSTTNSRDTLATATYGNISFAAIIRQGFVFGFQFHPEISALGGLNMIQEFIKLSET